VAEVDVCVIDDEQDQRRLAARLLTEAGFSVAEAGDVAAGLAVIAVHHPKIVLSDYHLPDGSGADLCRRLRADPHGVAVHFVLMTASGKQDSLVEAIIPEADDYLPKPLDKQSLLARVRVGLRMQRMHEQLHTAAITDGLTGLHNHDFLTRVLEQEMARSRRYGHPLALIMVDIDHFKVVNDTFGHLVGNAVLQEVARVLRQAVRDVDTVGRFGGEEFAVILPEATCAEAAHVAERMRRAVADSIDVKALRGHTVTASFGLADANDTRVTNTAQLLDLADRALYLAKRRGRNQVSSCYEVDEQAEVAATLQTDEIESLRRRVAMLSTRAKDVYVQSIASLVQALDEKDPYTARHCANVAFYAERVAHALGCSTGTIQSIKNAALLHDIGKVGIPDRILLKRTALSPVERMVMGQVPLIGTRIVDHLRILEAEVQIIRHQREHYDGTGQPAGLQGDQIPIGSRILLVVDAFDAMTTDRVYRARRPIEDALTELRDLAGRQFDPRAVAALTSALHDERPVWQLRIDESVNLLRLPDRALADHAATSRL